MADNEGPEPITDDLRRAIGQAIGYAQTGVTWKPDKAAQHLDKRLRLGHLPVGASLAEYESIIATILNDRAAKVYIFFYDNKPYPTIVATVEDDTWVVMMSLDGVMETAFPPDDPEEYLADPAFVYVGTLEALQSE